MKKILLGLAFAVALMTGCQKIDDLESRMNSAENDIISLKTELAKLQTAVANNYTIVSVTNTADGYLITFNNGTTAELKNGAKGDPGEPGKPGEKGDAFFKSVVKDNGVLTVTMMDGTVYTFPISAVPQVESLVFVPEYSDGCATVNFLKPSDAKMDMAFMVKPASLAEALKSCTFEIIAVGTVTRAEAPKTMAFASASVSDEGIIDIKGIDASKLDASFFTGATSAAAALVIKDGVSEISSEFVPVVANCTGLVYAGEVYATVTMKDGNVWMAENLRFIPDGVTPQADFTANTGMWYPGKLTWDGSKATVTPSTDAAVITAQGYLYTEEVALGAALPTADFENAANTQGICPDGWHIPTAAEWVGLVGACSDKNHSNTGAPYYDSTLNGASLEALNADGFNLLPNPYINGGKSYLGTVSNKDESKAYAFMASMAYFASSTARSDKQSYAAMITNNATKSSVNVAYNNLTNGVFVRCIKNK